MEQRELLEKLRGVHAGSPVELACYLSDLCDEAADEIDRLQQALDSACKKALANGQSANRLEEKLKEAQRLLLSATSKAN